MIRTGVSCLLLSSSLALAQPIHEIPADWHLALASPSPITVKLDHFNATSGASSVEIAREGSSTTGFVALMQATDAADYRGRRVRFSGDLKTQDVKDWGGLWFRVLDARGKTLAFDNMQKEERRVTGDTDWQRRDIVIDVPDRAANVLYGVTLNGTGKFWADGLRLEVVDQSVPITAKSSTLNAKVWLPSPLSSPRNLDFEE